MSLPPPPPPARSPWQRLYGGALALRRRLGRRAARSLPRPTLSVGNLHWGGGGKTPLILRLAEHLIESGRRVAILSRGYGRTTRGPVVVSAGEGPLVPVAESGDEPWLLAEAVPAAVVVVDGDRRRGGRRALELGAVDCFLLDDAFSHVRVRRDVDLLVFPAADPWGGGRLLPSGRLREPLGASRWADAALLTGKATPGAVAELAAGLRSHGFDGAAFGAPSRFTLADGDQTAPPDRVLLVSGIARPESFERAATELGLEVAEHLAFGDHHRYRRRHLRRIEERAATLAARVVTTAKDRPKLDGELRCPPLVLDLRCRPESRFWAWLDQRLAASQSSGGPTSKSGSPLSTV